MARIEWVKLRLNNWALWKEKESSGGLGYSTVSVLLGDPGGRDGYRESIIPVDDVDASTTNTAVESLKPTRPHLYETLQLIYPRGKGIKETSRIMGRAVSTINLNLEQADRALADWFTNRVEIQQKKEFYGIDFLCTFQASCGQRDDTTDIQLQTNPVNR